MAGILVGYDGSDRGKKALEWAAHEAQRTDISITLLTVIDTDVAKMAGVVGDELVESIHASLQKVANQTEADYPGVFVDVRIVNAGVTPSLISAAPSHNMIVLGSRQGPTVEETMSGARGTRIAAKTGIPVIVVPANWESTDKPGSIMVAVIPDGSSDTAITFAAKRAMSTGQPLELIAAWGLPAALEKTARVMGGGASATGNELNAYIEQLVDDLGQNYGLDVTGQAVEGPSPAKTILDQISDHDMLVMGTHAYSAFGRALFGSVGQAVLANIIIPTAIVPNN